MYDWLVMQTCKQMLNIVCFQGIYEPGKRHWLKVLPWLYMYM